MDRPWDPWCRAWFADCAVDWSAVGAVGTLLAALATFLAAGVALFLASENMRSEGRKRTVRRLHAEAIIAPDVFSIMNNLASAQRAIVRLSNEDTRASITGISVAPLSAIAEWIAELDEADINVLVSTYALLPRLVELSQIGDSVGPIPSALRLNDVSIRVDGIREGLEPLADRLWQKIHGSDRPSWLPIPVPTFLSHAERP